MKIVIAVDSFKGSLSSLEVGRSIEKGILRAMPDTETVVMPMADGGEGTVAAFLDNNGFFPIQCHVTGPLGETVCAEYAGSLNNKTAIIETAQAIGLTLVPANKRNPLHTSSYGVGELLLDALKRGYRDIVVGLGGSSTNDGGLGMLTALGARFFDEANNAVGITGKDLASVKRVDFRGLTPVLEECTIRIACDVNNPLCGPQGAAAVYGPQKGADDEIIHFLDHSLANYAQLLTASGCYNHAETPGAGAAGGLGYAFLLLPHAKLLPGASLLASVVGLEDELKTAHMLITGEGRMDFQTLMGKCPIAVAKIAKKENLPVFAFTGSADFSATACNSEGIDSIIPIVRGPISLEDAMTPSNAMRNIEECAYQTFLLIASVIDTDFIKTLSVTAT